MNFELVGVRLPQNESGSRETGSTVRRAVSARVRKITCAAWSVNTIRSVCVSSRAVCSEPMLPGAAKSISRVPDPSGLLIRYILFQTARRPIFKNHATKIINVRHFQHNARIHPVWIIATERVRICPHEGFPSAGHVEAVNLGQPCELPCPAFRLGEHDGCLRCE